MGWIMGRRHRAFVTCLSVIAVGGATACGGEAANPGASGVVSPVAGTSSRATSQTRATVAAPLGAWYHDPGVVDVHQFFESEAALAAWRNSDPVARLPQLQIPSDKLSSMTSAALAETSLAFPLWTDRMAYTTPQQGFEAVLSSFNGLRELQTRPDGAESLLAIYLRTNMAQIAASPGRPALSFGDLAMSLAQDAALAQLTPAQRVQLLEASLEKLQTINRDHPDVFSADELTWLVAKLVVKDFPESAALVARRPEIVTYLRTGQAVAGEAASADIGATIRQILTDRGYDTDLS